MRLRLRELIGNAHLRAAKGSRAADHTRRHYDENVITDQIIAVYDQCSESVLAEGNKR